ncbi:flagellar biosynthesis protein FlhF [Moorella thermoacetica]|uniref:Flagellar biosynthesis protein FlhF n=1 Tax=Moorella thermoacetica (strain ATCC 39073 / JCM 9320) TaxID=264732 RepID=Q2RKD0_MOOTA|nr:flagellar biosynthesis protein FlhF [Moorella thermoacetica]AKX93540.1 flagellar biosynthesis protein FlhF [Moorella thermoacetica]AKX96187.1 flagellar biosynthesis protein FlhF [Moorella thermoacetica]OIQ12504.1 flagellar biosynthesis protein FlhF [Moorella thermoacetica]OIQ55399.1 flagellar biosynthesis protein FlhF [Moorella thermoacetica]QCZ99997.1 Flagellar biosynthesis protein FlhF [Moorella thermoacetica]
MKIKRYLARDMQEAYLAIRRDLGPDAVIVATRRVRQPGLKGLFLPPRLEVTAALDTTSGAAAPAVPVKAGQPPGPGVLPGQDMTAPLSSTVSPGVGVGDRGMGPGLEGLRRELADIKATLMRLTHPEGDGAGGNAAWRQALLDQELAPELAADLVAGLDMTAGPEVIGAVIRNRLAERLAGQVLAESGQRVQAFVGPTGVGKTTTLAKVAARHSLYLEQKVGLITLDTYRIGAVDQLRTYAEIMGLPLEVAMTPREFREALGRLEDRDIILVDTAGRAPENKAMLAETRGFLEAMPEGAVYLVLSSATRRQDLLQAVERFRPLNYNRLIFTKLDETSCPGVMVTVAAAAGVPLAYVTAGQDVPDDLEVADPYLLAERIWKAVARDGPGGQVT